MTIRFTLATLIATSLAGSMAFGDNSEKILEARLRAAVPAPVTTVDDLIPQTLEKQAAALRATRVKTTAPTPALCNETRRTAFAGRYAITWDDAQGKLCRIYDLSFPTMFGTSAPRTVVSQIPVESLTANDYLAWLDGRYEDVYHRMEIMRTGFEASRVIPASWVKGLKFRPTAAGQIAATTLANGAIPRSFRASDLDLGNFKFSELQRRRLNAVLAETKAIVGGGATTMGLGQDFWQALADNPETLANKIKFDWNDARKVYDVILEFEFLPLRGPVSMVDNNVPYKHAVEALTRGIMRSMMTSLVRSIPAPVVRNIVEIAVVDSFEFLDLMYADRSALLEQGLRAAKAQELSAAGMDAAQMDRALDILFGSRSDLVSEYMMAAAQGRDINWTDVDKMGRLARYRTEKQLEITMARTNSNLVTQQKCAMERPWRNFGVCSKNGKAEAVYSLMSEQTILIWNLGAPMIHRVDRPSEVLLLRSTSWLLSAAVRVFDIPYVRFLQDALANALKGYSKAGMVDEANLRAQLLIQKKRDGQLSPENERLLGWLFTQNVNPFLPKSQSSDDKRILETGAKLGLTAETINLSAKQ